MKVGDRVKMSKAGRNRYRNEHDNPHDLEGTVVEPLHKGWTRVQWDNGSLNSYVPSLGSIETQPQEPKELRVKKTKAGTYNIKGLSFEQLKLIGITLGVQSGDSSRKTAPVYYVISDEVEKTEPDFITGYLHININLDNMKKGE